MNKKRRLTNKYILLAILLIAVFVLPSCRTRISNNSEITTVQYDEDGFMSEEYQMRRDELGLSTAEKPLLPNFGSGESDDNDDFEEGETIDYNPEDYQEDFSDTETNTNTNTNTTTRRTTTTGTRSNTTPSRSGTRGTRTTTISITFDPTSDGTIEGKNKGEKVQEPNIKKGSDILPPMATREGYTLTHWESSSGDKLYPKKMVQVSKTDTYVAKWKQNDSGGGEKEKEKPVKYTVSFNVNYEGGSNPRSITVTKGGKYENLPTPEKRRGYTFIKWVDSSGNEIKKGSPVKITKKHTLTAVWSDYDAETFWKEENNEKAGKFTKIKYIALAEADPEKPEINGLLEDQSGLVSNVMSNLGESKNLEEAETIILYVTDWDNVDRVGDAAKDYYKKRVIVMNAIITSPKTKEELLYKILALSQLYEESGIDAEKAAVELGGNEDDLLVRVFNYSEE